MAKFKDKPFVLLGVNTDASREIMHRAEVAQHMSWRSIWDGQNESAANAYGVKAFPTMYLIDAQGRVATKPLVGLQDDKQLESAIERLLEETNKSQ